VNLEPAVDAPCEISCRQPRVRQVADPARGARNQHPLAGLETSVHEQALPGVRTVALALNGRERSAKLTDDRFLCKVRVEGFA
jgi:hypothetical protein